MRPKFTERTRKHTMLCAFSRWRRLPSSEMRNTRTSFSSNIAVPFPYLSALQMNSFHVDDSCPSTSLELYSGGFPPSLPRNVVSANTINILGIKTSLSTTQNGGRKMLSHVRYTPVGEWKAGHPSKIVPGR